MCIEYQYISWYQRFLDVKYVMRHWELKEILKIRLKDNFLNL